MPAHRFTSRAGVIQRGRGACERLRAPPLRLTRPTRFRGEPPPPASAGKTDCFRLDRPSAVCLATCREAQPRCVLIDFCFPLLRLRAPAPHRFPASLRSFRFARGQWTCTHYQETGGPSVSRRRIRFGGPLGLARSVLLHALPTEPYLWHPCRLLNPIVRRFREARVLRPPRPRSKPLREDEVSQAAIQGVFHR